VLIFVVLGEPGSAVAVGGKSIRGQGRHRGRGFGAVRGQGMGARQTSKKRRLGQDPAAGGDSQSQEPVLDEGENEALGDDNQVKTLVAPDGTEWAPSKPGAHVQGRRAQQNVLREFPGPTGYASRLPRLQ